MVPKKLDSKGTMGIWSLRRFPHHGGKPTVCPPNDSANMLSYQSLPTSIQVRRGHGQEAERGAAGGHRIPWHGEAIESFLLPCAPPGCP